MEPYDKGSHAKTAGFMYEIKLLTLCMLRGLLNNRNFKMATEMEQKHVGKFDDVVYFFEDSERVQRCFLVQCKHASPNKKNITKLCRANLLSDKDKDIGIIQYLRSYLEHIKKNQELGVVDGLVLFTNRDVDKKMVTDKDLKKLGDNDREFIKFCRGKEEKSLSFFSLSEDFVKELKPILSSYYLDEICSNFFGSVLHKKKIDLRWDSRMSAFERFQLTIYYKILDLKESSDGTFSIKGLQEEFVYKDEHLREFRLTFIKHLEIKSSEFIKKIPNEKVSDRFGFENLQVYFNIFRISVDIDSTFTSMGPNTEDLSLQEIISDTDLENFQKLFVLAAGQPNVEDIEKVIDEALEQHPILQNVDPRDASKFLISHIHKWADSREGFFLDSRQATEIINSIYSESMLSRVNFSIWGVIYRNIIFQETHLDDINNLIQDNKSNTIQIYCKGSAKLLMLQLRQTFSTKDYLYLDLNSIDKWMGEGIDLPKLFKASKVFVGVVIDLTSYSNQSDKVDSFLSCEKKAILVVPSNTPIIDKFQDIQSISAEPLVTNFDHLSPETRSYLRSKKIINVHGRMRSINDLLPNIDDSNINNDILHDLVVRNLLVVGEVPDALFSLPGAYSKTYRIIPPQNFIELLRKEQHCKFAISGSKDLQTTENSLLSIFDRTVSDVVKNNITYEVCMNDQQKIILFCDDDLVKFQSICKKNQDCVIYRINIDDGTLVINEIFNPDYYVEREFRIVKEVTFTKAGLNYFIKENGLDEKICLVVAKDTPNSTTDEWEKSSSVFVCRAEEAEELFANKCSQKDPKLDEVYWLTLNGTEFKLMKSHGSKAFIREYKEINETEDIYIFELCNENMLFDEVHSNVILISDEAGTGKSTTLVSMCNKLITLKCVYMIDLKNGNVKKLLDNLISEKINEEDCVLKLLTSNDNSALLRFLVGHLLQKPYDETDGLALIFDGIDEVSQEYQNGVMKTMKHIENKTKCRICIASRKSCQPLLEDQFCRLAITIDGMSANQQEKLINKQQKVKFYQDNQSMTEKIASQMKEIFGHSEFSALPLYLRLVTEISLRDLENVDGRVYSIKNVKELFDRIVNVRYTIHYAGEESNRLNEHNRLHAEFAFQLLFPDYSVDSEAEEQLKDQKSTYLSIGMLYSQRPENFDFVHQTFCEYFCAMYLVGCLKKKKGYHLYKMAQQVLSQDWFWPRRSRRYEMLARFTNTMLEEDFTNGSQIDRLGRSLEHVYASTGRIDELSLLKTLPESLHTDILGRTPFHYAIKHVRNISFLFYKSELSIQCYHDNILNQPFSKYGSSPSTLYAGNTAFESSKWNQIVNAEDIGKHSCLYYAAVTGNWAVCIWLLTHGADCRVLSERQKVVIIERITYWCTHDGDYGNNGNGSRIPVTHGLPVPYRYQTVPDQYRLAALPLLLSNEQLIFNVHTPKLMQVYGGGRVVATHNGKFTPSHLKCILHFEDHEHLKIIKHLDQLKVLDLDTNYIKRVIEWGHTETFKCMLEHLPEIIKRAGNPIPEFMRLAISYNRTSIVEYIWSFHKESTSDEDGRTPLLVAAGCGNLHLVKYFYENGDNANFLALHFAAKSFHNMSLNIIKYLVKQGENINLKDRCENTTLDTLIETVKDHLDDSKDFHMIFECIKFLVQDCKADSKYGDQALREQIVSATHDTVNACVDGSTLLHKAVSMSAHGLVAYLLYKGADVFAKDVSGRTVLDLSFSCDKCDGILFKYATQCSLNEWQDMPKEKRKELLHGDTMLHMAARRGDICEVERLMQNGAMFDFVNNEGLTPERCLNNMNRYTDLFFKASTLFKRVERNQSGSIFRDLFGFYKYRDKSGKSLLHWAVQNNCLSWVDFLQERRVCLEVKDNDGMTPLHYAVQKKDLRTTYGLLKNGAIFNPIDIRLRPLLEVFTQDENPCVTKLRIIQDIFILTERCQFDKALSTLYFLASDANFVAAVIHTQDRRGNTLLHYAAANGSFDMVKFVLRNGGCYDPCNIDSETPLDVTRSPDIYSLLSFMNNLDVTDLWKTNLEGCQESIVNAKDTSGYLTCLHRVYCFDVAKWLKKIYPDTDVEHNMRTRIQLNNIMENLLQSKNSFY